MMPGHNPGSSTRLSGFPRTEPRETSRFVLTPLECTAMIRQWLRKARPADWAAGIIVPTLCAGFVLAQAPPPAAAPGKLQTTDDGKVEAAPNPKSASAAVELDKKIMTEIADKSELMKNLGYLSDVIGPRLTGTAALKKAND